MSDSLTLVPTIDDPRHGFEADEEFLAMLTQVYFMYYNVRRSIPR